MRKHNVMPIVHPRDEDLNIVRVGRYEDWWSLRYAKYVCNCRHCGEDFLSDRPHTKYHSKACRQAAYRLRKKEANRG